MLSFAYLAALLVSIAGTVVIDARGKLFVFAAPRRALAVLGIGVAFFLLWDLAGIGAGVFFRGNPELLTGVQLAPELPLEELFFLILLCWTTMNLVALAERLLHLRARDAGADAEASS